jgi:2-deoxy-D-gluconate 3-dehydrogenase
MARGLAAAGARVALAARNQTKTEEAAAGLMGEGGEVLAVEADVTREEDCQRLVRTVVSHWGRLDVLVNNAGTNDRKPPEAYLPAEWNALLTTNLTSAFLRCQAAYPEMVVTGAGKMINIGSMLSLFGASFAAPYAAAKAESFS